VLGTWLLGHFHSEIQHVCLVIFIQKIIMAAWSFSFKNSSWLLCHFHSEIHHGCVVIFIQKFNMAAVSECLIIFIQKLNMAAWSFSFRNST
jgi:hypothetical protein